MAMLQLQKEVERLTNTASLSKVAEDVDQIIALLSEAREKIASANDPHTTSLTLTKLQNPIKDGVETLNGDFKKIHKAHTEFQKGLKSAFSKTKGELPTDHDPMESHQGLINRAIAMHLLREGQFDVVSTFVNEAHPQDESQNLPPNSQPPQQRPTSPTDTVIADADTPSGLTALQSQTLQSSFAEMYSILSSLKAHDLNPAIAWARANNAELETRGSNLEFELCKLQFIWIFKGPDVNGHPHGLTNGVSGALQYARSNFHRFQQRHIPDIQKLSAAMVFAPNLYNSPYQSMFDISAAFDEVASSFTREFCSLLGLSAESPLYVAVTAGSLALPQLVKYTSMTKAKGTEWTTDNELAFETPLPRSMVYHSIFVCPVSKEQTTENNPPVILPCGHVLAKDSLHKLAKGSRYKCPYCPCEGHVRNAEEIIL